MSIRTRLARLCERRSEPPSVLILIDEHGEIRMGNKTLTWDEAQEAAEQLGVMIVRIVREDNPYDSRDPKD